MTANKASDDWASLVETLEVLSDQDLLVALRQSLQEADRGETIPWEKVKIELDRNQGG
jgi:hypothetical protein